MLRLISRSLVTYKKSSAKFEGGKCLLVLDTETKWLLDQMSTHYRMFTISFIPVFGLSKYSLIGMFSFILLCTPQIFIFLAYLSRITAKVNLLEDGETIEIESVLNTTTIKTKLSNIKLNTPIDEQRQEGMNRYKFFINSTPYFITGSAKIHNIDLLNDVLSGNNIEFTED